MIRSTSRATLSPPTFFVCRDSGYEFYINSFGGAVSLVGNNKRSVPPSMGRGTNESVELTPRAARCHQRERRKSGFAAMANGKKLRKRWQPFPMFMYRGKRKTKRNSPSC